MMMWTTLLTMLMTVTCVCYGHLCMISPPQRGSMVDINKPGASDCILLKSPCGARAMAKPRIALMGGEDFTVALQKNLNHFNKSSPGYFSISIGASATSLKEIAKFMDNADPSLTLYLTNVTIPAVHGAMILQSRYITNNPQAPPIFYQCADLIVA